MRRLVLVLAILFVAGFAFADITGSVSETAAYDLDAEKLTNTVGLVLKISTLSVSNTLAIVVAPGVLTEFDYTLSLSYPITSWLSATLTYANDNINADATESEL